MTKAEREAENLATIFILETSRNKVRFKGIVNDVIQRAEQRGLEENIELAKTGFSKHMYRKGLLRGAEIAENMSISPHIKRHGTIAEAIRKEAEG